MKNMIEICKDFGIEIPADKHAEFNKAVAENYKTVAEHEKKVNRLTDDLAAEKKRADEAVASHQKEQEDREFKQILETAITEAKGKNTKAITALLDIDKLRNSRNQEKDIKSALETLRTESGYLFDDNGGKARFTTTGGAPAAGKKYSMSDVMKMTNENPAPDIKQLMNIGGNN